MAKYTNEAGPGPTQTSGCSLAERAKVEAIAKRRNLEFCINVVARNAATLVEQLRASALEVEESLHHVNDAVVHLTLAVESLLEDNQSE
jgi:hypothetical protein